MNDGKGVPECFHLTSFGRATERRRCFLSLLSASSPSSWMSISVRSFSFSRVSFSRKLPARGSEDLRMPVCGSSSCARSLEFDVLRLRLRRSGSGDDDRSSSAHALERQKRHREEGEQRKVRRGRGGKWAQCSVKQLERKRHGGKRAQSSALRTV